MHGKVLLVCKCQQFWIGNRGCSFRYNVVFKVVVIILSPDQLDNLIDEITIRLIIADHINLI